MAFLFQGTAGHAIIKITYLWKVDLIEHSTLKKIFENRPMRSIRVW